MSEEYDEETKKVIEITKKRLEGLISKTSLIQDKLLTKPPISYIKAMTLQFITDKGYPEGLWDEELLKKKEGTADEKQLFLRQLINVVAHTLRKNIPVSLALMMKGKESAKNCCLFFQALADAAQNKEKYKYKEAIEKIKSGKYKDVTEKKKEDDGAQQPPTQPTQPQQTQSPTQNQPSQPKPTEPTQPKQQAQSQPVSPTTVPNTTTESRPTSKGATVKPATPKQEERSTTPTSIDIQNKNTSSRPSSREPVKPSTPNTEDQTLNQDDPNQYSRPFSSRGQSARRAPPKIKTNVRNIDTQEMPTEKAPVERATEGLITDEHEDKEEEQIIIEKNVVRQPVQQNNNSGQGNLVSKLKENENDIEKKRGTGKSTKIDDTPTKGIVLQTGKKEKDKETVTTELSSLRDQIQVLISKANPLGKTMDYIQEDLDSMQRENDMWKKEVETQRQRLVEERLKTEQEIQGVQAQLRELEQNISDKLEKINSTKSAILQNDKLLENLLRNVVT